MTAFQLVDHPIASVERDLAQISSAEGDSDRLLQTVLGFSKDVLASTGFVCTVECRGTGSYSINIVGATLHSEPFGKAQAEGNVRSWHICKTLFDTKL